MREEPEDGNLFFWDKFCEWADENDLGIFAGDWEDWWFCWKAACIEALRVASLL
jgi:hypothetical protein